jgi:L-seryl-tRNA(Ser) seleniumtransferase
VPLVEVGTTNRTRLADYEGALADHPDAVVLRAHPSNFRTVGFVEEVPIERLCELGVPVVDDVGSGALGDVADEPPVRRSIRAGAALVCFSGDKLLGGPQAGLIAGRRDAVEAARRHPLARAMRIDKLSLAALEATLALYRDPARALAEVPVLAMLNATEDELLTRARRIGGEVVRATAKVGGGALPLLELEGPVVALDSDRPDALAAALRQADPPILARIADGRVLLDPRTMTDADADHVAEVLRRLA